jgi:hypothetical protein
MKNTIKFVALGACALAATSTAALAGSELPKGITTGLSIGMPLPEGVYDVSVASYGAQGPNGAVAASADAYSIPVWLIWWTPWRIAGGRVVLDTATGVADSWTEGQPGTDSWLNTLVEGGIGWNLGNGWGASVHAGAWLPSTQTLPMVLGRDYTAFQGAAAISYVAGGWNLSATGIYGSGGNKENTAYGAGTAQQADWFNLDLTAVKHYGKYETGLVAYGSWDLSNNGFTTCAAYTGLDPCKQSQFAVGGLAGYDFGAFLAQLKLIEDVQETNYTSKEARGTLTIVKPLWNPAAEGALK